MRWEEKKDLEYDRLLVRSAVREILSSERLRLAVIERPYLLIEAAFHIVDKTKTTVPFFLNAVQREFIDAFERYGTERPYFVLKGRQQGFTSLITAMQLSYAVVRKNFSGFTLADRADNTLAIFHDKARMVYERLPEELKPTERFSSKKELFFDRLNSSWRVSTATGSVGRSRTLNFVHFSEVAFYDCSLSDLQKGIGEAMTEDAICIYETTANGWNEAKTLWDSGSCRNLFFEWWKTPEYRCEDPDWLQTDDAWLRSRIRLLRDRGLTDEQIAWYCRKYAGYLDKSTVRQEYPCSPEEAFVFGGGCVFEKEKITDRLTVCGREAAPRRGYFTYRTVGIPFTAADGSVVGLDWQITDIRFEESSEGYILLHEEPRVRLTRDGRVCAEAPYVIGGDTAGGGADHFAAKVICNLDGKTAATLHKRQMDEDLYAEQLYCLGRYYHDALIAVETNYSRHPVRVLQQKYRYPKLYMRERLDRTEDTVEKVCGFETTALTKPVIIGELVRVMRETPEAECDPETLREMLTFVRKANGKTEAVNGMHDDLVMALAIAHHASGQQTRTWVQASDETDEAWQGWFHLEAARSENAEYMNWEDMGS